MMIMNSSEKKNHLATKILIPISVMALYKINNEDNHKGFYSKQIRKEDSPIYSLYLVFLARTMPDQRKDLL